MCVSLFGTTQEPHLMNKTTKTINQTVLSILKYLEINPEAMDTEKGIGMWWVSEEDIKNVPSALARMIRRKVIQEKLLNGKKYYLLNEVFRDQARLRETILTGFSGPGRPSRKRSKSQR